MEKDKLVVWTVFRTPPDGACEITICDSYETAMDYVTLLAKFLYEENGRQGIIDPKIVNRLYILDWYNENSATKLRVDDITVVDKHFLSEMESNK